MSESEDENENFCFFGKPLDPYDEDAIPKRRPISVEDQIATDAQGRRRFHGAFTGGFSAGFFNTVGSLEGWTPSEFKSSRAEKSERLTQKPRDFMDDEDLGEDGIAPQVVRATSDYNSSKKRKKVFSDGPIPGEPVLHNILTSGNETIGYMLLRNLRVRDKVKQKEEEKRYGCQMPSAEEMSYNEGNEYEIPELYKENLAKPKSNTFGLSYSGLDKGPFSLFPLENKSKLVVTDKNNKKLSITGQAFGVGAFEEDDDDIYMKEDMSKYDFELVGEQEKVKRKKETNKLVLGLFAPSVNTPVLKNALLFPPPQIPHSFTGKHKVKRSRFEPIPHETNIEDTSRINPMIRAKYLGEETDKEFTASKTTPVKHVPPKKEETNNSNEPEQGPSGIESYLNDRFVSSGQEEDVNNILESVEKLETVHGTEQMRDAARMKMFGPLTRITSDWVPCSLLCKRFNVPEPFVERPEKSRTRTKNIIFEYQKHLEENNLLPGLKTQPEEKTEVKREETKQPDLVVDDLKEAEPVESAPPDITDRIDLEKQQDLFKAIFMSSDSESDREDEVKKQAENTAQTRKEELKSMILTDQLIPKIKPMKEGVLSGINFLKLDSYKAQESIKIEPEQKQEPESNIDSYGPAIPAKLINPIKAIIRIETSESDDAWIEKGSDDSKKMKKHKKIKKHKKDKHKKHKHEKKKRYNASM